MPCKFIPLAIIYAFIWQIRILLLISGFQFRFNYLSFTKKKTSLITLRNHPCRERVRNSHQLADQLVNICLRKISLSSSYGWLTALKDIHEPSVIAPFTCGGKSFEHAVTSVGVILSPAVRSAVVSLFVRCSLRRTNRPALRSASSATLNQTEPCVPYCHQFSSL